MCRGCKKKLINWRTENEVNIVVVGRIKLMIKPGIVTPKPDAKSDFIIKGWGKRRGEDALIYCIPNHQDRNKPYQKGIAVCI